MAKGNGAASAFASVPDPRDLLGSWDEISGRFGAQSTAWSREALLASLRLLEQGAANTSECLHALGQGTQRLGELARATEHRIGAAEDIAGVWNLELGLLGESMQVAAALGQDAWLALARTHTGLLQAALSQGAQAVEAWAPGADGDAPAPAAPEPSALPLAALPWPAWTETAAQGAQAWWNAMAATAAAATQAAAAQAAPSAAGAPKPAPRARRRSR